MDMKMKMEKYVEQSRMLDAGVVLGSPRRVSECGARLDIWKYI